MHQIVQIKVLNSFDRITDKTLYLNLRKDNFAWSSIWPLGRTIFRDIDLHTFSIIFVKATINSSTNTSLSVAKNSTVSFPGEKPQLLTSLTHVCDTPAAFTAMHNFKYYVNIHRWIEFISNKKIFQWNVKHPPFRQYELHEQVWTCPGCQYIGGRARTLHMGEAGSCMGAWILYRVGVRALFRGEARARTLYRWARVGALYNREPHVDRMTDWFTDVTENTIFAPPPPPRW